MVMECCGHDSVNLSDMLDDPYPTYDAHYNPLDNCTPGAEDEDQEEVDQEYLLEPDDYAAAGLNSPPLQSPLLNDTFSIEVDDQQANQPSLPLLAPSTSDTASVISTIEHIFENHIDVLLGNSTSLSLSLRTRSQVVQTYTFPGATIREAWRFTVILRLLDLIHEALTSSVVWTKRDLFYRDPLLFSTQSVVDRYVDDIARTFEVQRSQLNITAAAKGLVVGPFSIWSHGETIMHGLTAKSGTLITHLPERCMIDMSAVKWILVVEKEACFRSLSESVFWSSIEKEGILLTAKGYPDIASRAFLNLLSTPSIANGNKSCPVYGLFDCDPDSFRIMSTYKNSSEVLGHESSSLACPTMQWLGLKTSQLHVGRQDNDAVLLPLTARDRRHASLMLERSCGQQNGQELEWQHELQRMLMLNKKAEIQLLEQSEGGLARWLHKQGF